MQTTNSVMKVKIGKYFRLIDFQVFDGVVPKDVAEDEDSDEEDDDEVRVAAKDKQFMIQMFGINEAGETASITITDYNPFFFVNVGDQWTARDADEFAEHLRNHPSIKYLKSAILSAELVDRHKLYGFTGGRTHKFVQLTFRNSRTMNAVRRLWYNGPTLKPIVFPAKGPKRCRTALYESTLQPLLRYFHIHNMSPSGWVRVAHTKCRVITGASKTTTCKYEYVCQQKHVFAATDKETKVPYKICSFDIEASSSHGDFPVPIKSYKKLAVNTVEIFQVQEKAGLTKARAEQLLQKIIQTAFGYAEFDDVDVVYPIEMPSKDRLRTLIDRMLRTELNGIETTEEADSALAVMNMFDKLREADKPTGAFVANSDFQDANVDDDGDSDEEEGAEDSDAESDTSFSDDGAKKGAGGPAAGGITIVDYLLDKTQVYDKRVETVNEVMTRILPKLEGDKVTFIGSTFMRYGEQAPYLNHCVVLGSCDPVDGAKIETAATERDLLLRWTKIMAKENPDIIIGYNIFGFDYEFMYRRSQETGCEREFLKFSRKLGEFSGKEIYNKDTCLTTTDLENTKVALASGEYDLRYFKMTGRVQLDLYSYFRRDFNLSSYKLDDVAANFISDSIIRIELDSDTERTYIVSKNLQGLHVNDYIHIEITGFSSDYYNDGQKFRVVDIVEYAVEEESKNKKGEMEKKMVSYKKIGIAGLHAIDPKGRSMRWGMAKDDVSPQDIFRLSNGSAADRAIVAKYCIQDCNLVHYLMNKVDVLTGFTEMARICSVPISYLILRGQGIKLTSYVAKECREKNTLMPDLEKTRTGEGYEGAIVLPPKCSMYMDNPVACVDYSSLYPSSMISQNYSHDSKVWTKEYDLNGWLINETGEKDAAGNYVYDNLPGYTYIHIEFDTYKYLRNPNKPKSKEKKTKVGKMVCCWAQLPDGKKSIMPSILENLLKARKTTRKMAEAEAENGDPFLANILDKRQLGYKVTANSLYGQCGAKTSTFYERDVAACTTATGRMMITYAKRIIETVYGNLVYDTVCQGPVKCMAEYVYGDSVADYTPVHIRINGENAVCTISELAEKYGNNNWVKCTEPGKQEKEFCELTDVETWTESGWTRLYRVIRHELAAHKKMVRIITRDRIITRNQSCVDVTDDHSLLRPDGSMLSPKECAIGTALLACGIDGCPTEEYIVSMEPIQYAGYVYDLTTENHHFAAGVGNLIVHNTDSVFFTFNLEHPETGEKIRGKPALEATIEIAQHAADLCSQFLKPPMDLTYEKTLMPFILLSKKRYVGMLYETNPNKGKLKFMGLVLKRRDNCDIVKDVYGGVLNILMKSYNIQAAIDFLQNCLTELVDGKVTMDKLTITKALRGYYKKPQQIAHRVLADRMAARDPGNKPKAGDRIKYAFIVNAPTKGKKLLQGEKIEPPEYIAANGLKLDYTHYITNQIMKPLQQLFGLALEQIMETKGRAKEIPAFRAEVRKLQDQYGGDLQGENLEKYMKQREKLSSRRIKTILFDPVLQQIYNKQNGIRTIDGWLRPKVGPKK